MARTMQVAGARNHSGGSLKALHRAIVANSVKAKQILDGNGELKLNELVEGATALIRACCYGRTPVIRELLTRKDIDVNVRFTKDGSTALMCACSTERQSTEAVSLLLAFPGVDVNALSQSHGFTALMYAVCKGHEEVVHALLEHPDIAVNAASNEEKTALMYAAERSFLPIVEALLEHPSIDVTLKDKKGNTALDLAVEPEVEFVLRAQTTQLPTGGPLRAMIGAAAPRPRMSTAITSPVRSPVPQHSSTSSRGAPFAPVDLTSDAEDGSDEESEEDENDKAEEGGSSSDGESASEADEDESNVVSNAGSHASDTGSASGSGSGSSSESDSDTDDEIVLPVQAVAPPAALPQPPQVQTTTTTATTTTTTERTWLATRLLEAGYGEQDVANCEQRIIHEQRFVSEAIFAVSTNVDDAALLSIGIKELGLRAFLLDLQRVMHLKRAAALVTTAESRPAKRVRST